MEAGVLLGRIPEYHGQFRLPAVRQCGGAVLVEAQAAAEGDHGTELRRGVDDMVRRRNL